MPSHEFTYWIDFYGRNPFGSLRDNMHAALIAQRVGNSSLAEDQTPFAMDDFMLKSEAETKRDSTRELMSFMLRISDTGVEDG